MLRYGVTLFVIIPPVAFLLLYAKVTDQPDGRSAAQAREYIRYRVVRHPIFWAYIVFITILLGAYFEILIPILRWISQLT